MEGNQGNTLITAKSKLALPDAPFQGSLSGSPGTLLRKPPPSSRNLFYRYIPNILTTLRLAAAPAVMGALTRHYFLVTVYIFSLACLTDWLDGYLARRWRTVSRLGQILDPLADKILIMTLYMTLSLQGYIPLWLAVLVWGRDLLILAIGGFIMMNQKTPAVPVPHMLGKIATTLHMVFIGLVLLDQAGFEFLYASGTDSPAMLVFIYILAAITIFSGLQYGWTAFKLFRKRSETIKA